MLLLEEIKEHKKGPQMQAFFVVRGEY